MNFKPYRKGVTLIELSVVILILSVMFTAIFATYYTSITITKKIRPADGEDKIRVLSTLEIIRQTIVNTFYLEGEKRLIFLGQGSMTSSDRSDRIDFAAAHPEAFITMTPEVREVSFYLKPDLSGNSDEFLLIKREDEMVDDDPLQGGIEHVLLKHVTGFRLDYSEDATRWLDQWDTRKKNKLPRLVKISISVNSEGDNRKYETLAFPGIYFK